MSNIIAVEQGQYIPQIQELFSEYLQWGNDGLKQEFGISLDVPALLASDMGDLDKYMPPRGRLLLALVNDLPAGTLCLTGMTPKIGEVRRMYVQPLARRQGLGGGLLDRLLQEACSLGFEKLRLDSPLFMTGAHRLYRRAGFKEVEPYPGSEIPEEFQQHWIFMEMSLP